MYGEELVWEKRASLYVDLGTHTFENYDITGDYADYSSLTKDNFFVVTMSNASGSSAVTTSGSTVYLTLSGELVKSYNASTGKLTCYNKMAGNSTTGKGSVHVVIVSDPSKLVSLGSAQSFNVSSQKGYKDFTVDNFLIKNVTKYSENHARTENGTWNCSGTMKLAKSYNASKGLLTCYYYEQGSNNANNVDFVSKKLNAEVYLMP